MIKYNIKLELNIVYPDAVNNENLKSSHELSHDICEMIADQLSQVDGYLSFNIIDAKRIDN